MKRHPVLQPLSREHHVFLTWCRNVRWFAEDTPHAPEWDTLVAEWRGNLTYIEAHFKREEKELFPFVSTWLHEDSRPYIHRLQAEHQHWRTLLAASEDPPTLSQMVAFATHLHDHIRYEERVFFPWLQTHLTEAQWQQLSLA